MPDLLDSMRAPPSPNWREIRSHFPALAETTYLNTAGGGPMCREAWGAVRRYYDSFYARGDTQWDGWLEEVEKVRARLAQLLGASPGEVAFLSNASQGLNLVADMLAPEGEILALADDFPSVTLPWLRRGYSLRFLRSASEGAVSPEVLEQALSRNIGLFAVGAVQYRTGFRLDLEGTARLCQERNIPLVIDATQGFGVFSIDLRRSPASALGFSAYKWATAGYGIAPLVVRSDVLGRCGLPSVGWRSAREPYALEGRSLDLTDEARGLEMGHPPFAGVLALGGALQLLESIGLDAIERRIETLVERLHRELDQRGLPIMSPRQPEQRAGITMIRFDNPPLVAQELRKRKIFVSARGNGVRVSIHFFNDETDIERLVSALDAMGLTSRQSR